MNDEAEDFTFRDEISVIKGYLCSLTGKAALEVLALRNLLESLKNLLKSLQVDLASGVPTIPECPSSENIEKNIFDVSQCMEFLTFIELSLTIIQRRLKMEDTI